MAKIPTISLVQKRKTSSLKMINRVLPSQYDVNKDLAKDVPPIKSGQAPVFVWLGVFLLFRATPAAY